MRKLFPKNRFITFGFAVTLIAFAMQEQASAEEQIGQLNWHTDYFKAYRQAADEKKMLFVFFHDATQPNVTEGYKNSVLAADDLQEPLTDYVRLLLPVDTTLPVAEGEEKPQQLLDHTAFKYMYKRSGIGVLDLIDDETNQYGKLISAHPFSSGRHYTTSSTKVVLDLPRGSVTQRALIYAVRIHPEGPRSADCQADPSLLSGCCSHSGTMARLEQVGHHGWGHRFQSLTAQCGMPVKEVAAVSWGGESLIEGAKDCVASWRTSPGHWSGVAGSHALFGYDMVRSRSGKWYATGLFASGR